MGDPVKKQVENGLNNLFDVQGQKIDVSDQVIFTLKDLGLHDEEGNEKNINNPLTETQSLSGRFLSFMITNVKIKM